ncbi:MAG: ABC-2 family transporter protein [Candidatus Nanoarchaeia archaeon]|nr:ABC-2 family transporter protein [Candidatus Nanoarchaeia archaeon]
MNYFFAFIKQSFKESTKSRVVFFINIFGKIIFFIINFYLWQAIFNYDGRGVINGLTMEETINYMLFVSIMYGLLSTNIHRIVMKDVKNGYINIKLLRPLDYGLGHLAMALGQNIYSFFLEIIPSLIIAIFFFNFKIYGIFYFLLSFISFFLAIILNFFIDLNFSLINFKFIDTYSAVNFAKSVFKSLFSGEIVPLNFFPQIMQQIFKFLPTTYLFYTPIMIYLGKLSGADIILSFIFQLIFIIFFYAIYKFFWKMLTKSFEGVGV